MEIFITILAVTGMATWVVFFAFLVGHFADKLGIK